MSIDAMALLPPLGELSGEDQGEGWKLVDVPGGPRGAWKPLRDGAIVGLGLPIAYPDADLYAAAKDWLKEQKAPARIWVFPDTAVPDSGDVDATRAATKLVGRWVRPSKAQPSFLEELGLSAAEAKTWQREAMSGDPARVDVAAKMLEQRLGGRSTEEMDRLIADFLKKQ